MSRRTDLLRLAGAILLGLALGSLPFLRYGLGGRHHHGGAGPHAAAREVPHRHPGD